VSDVGGVDVAVLGPPAAVPGTLPGQPLPVAAPEPETRERPAQSPPWNVIVHNDPVNLMSYVTLVFQRVFGYARDRAEAHMWEVHTKGSSILWTGELERAEGYLRELHASQLLATLERAG
jgi:ATP-dependent Clp protease adaptor protein ClpS